jgi:F-type H+-transporting ATPase subunit b
LSRYKTIGTAIALTLLTAAAAFAADGQAEGGQSPEINFVWRLLNIAVFVGIMYKIVGAKAKAFFTGRRDGIRTELENLETRKAEAELHLAEIKKRIANLDAECNAILEESKAQAEQLKAVILAEAHKQAEQVREQALRTAENEGKAAIEQLRAALADEIVAAAEALLQAKLDGAQHEKLINKSLTKVVFN